MNIHESNNSVQIVFLLQLESLLKIDIIEIILWAKSYKTHKERKKVWFLLQLKQISFLSSSENLLSNFPSAEDGWEIASSNSPRL